MDETHYTEIITLLKQLENTQNMLYEKTLHLDNRIGNIEKLINEGYIKKDKSKKIVIKRSVKPNNTITLIDINTIKSCEPQIKHIDIVFFSSLEFAFCIVLLETLCNMSHIDNTCTTFVYEEAEFCDNHYHLDIKSQLLRMHGWFEDQSEYKPMLPFKHQDVVDVDKKTKHQKEYPILGYYKNKWCSMSYRDKLLSLYESFCIKIIQQFGNWQEKYSSEIERNKLPKNLDYSECVLKIMGSHDNSKSSAKSIDDICGYLSNIV